MASDWDQAAAKVKKILGDKAKIPPLPGNLVKTVKDSDKAWEEFDKARQAVEDKLLAWQNSGSTIANTLKQFADKLESEDFGLDKSESDYKKKRAEAQKVLDAYFEGRDKNIDANTKGARELDRHLRNITSYKSPDTIEV